MRGHICIQGSSSLLVFLHLSTSYLFFGLALSKVQIFILVTVLGALDFWTVKNVTGRLLVGLRWWSDFDDTGKEIWRFESYDQEFKTNSVDVAFFWTSQLVGTLLWALLLVIKILSLSAFWVFVFRLRDCWSSSI